MKRKTGRGFGGRKNPLPEQQRLAMAGAMLELEPEVWVPGLMSPVPDGGLLVILPDGSLYATTLPDVQAAIRAIVAARTQSLSAWQSEPPE